MKQDQVSATPLFWLLRGYDELFADTAMVVYADNPEAAAAAVSDVLFLMNPAPKIAKKMAEDIQLYRSFTSPSKSNRKDGARAVS